MAVADIGGAVAGRRVEVLVADHRNNPDVAASTVRQWFDAQGLDALIGGVNSSTSLAMARVAREKRKPFLAVGAGNSAHTNEQCSPYTVQYAYDTTALGKVAGAGLAKAGGGTWYFLTADVPFYAQIEDGAKAALRAAGGGVAGSARHPFPTGDFSPLLPAARSSGAQVLGLGNGHTDTINAVRAASELGLTATMRVVSLFAFIDEVHAIGLERAQGLYVADSWWWDRDDQSRAWSRRFFERFNRMPSSLHAADYSAASQYLAAVAAAGGDDGDKVLDQMRATTINDAYARNGRVRGDGLMVHDMHLLRVKSPARSTGSWDYYELVETFQGDAAWATRAESRCERWQ